MNGNGHILTLDIDQFHINEAQELWNKLNLQSYISPLLKSSLEFEPKDMYQFIFLDSEPSLRLKELIRFYPNLLPGGFVLIHDMPPDQCRGNVNTDHPDFPNWPIGEIPKEFDEMIKTRKLIPSYFPDARSLAIFYKPTERDFI